MTKFDKIGQRTPKLDALDKATGRAVYGHDLRLPGMLHGKILWSEYPFARIRSVNTERARRLPGVKAVLTGADNPGRRFGYGKDNTPLKADVVRWYGDAVAAVAAVDEDTALEALSLIEVDFEPLAPIFEAEAALQPDAPIIHEWRTPASNLFTRFDYGHGDGPIEAVLDQADAVVEDSFNLPHVTHACLETSFALASFDHRGRLTLYSTTQIPFLLQRDLAEALGMSGRDIRVIQTAIGGGFGRGLDIYPFEPIAAMLARASGRPVRLAFSRRDEFRAAPVRQPARGTIRTAVRRDGTLLARDVDLMLDCGAYVSWGVVTPLVMMETVASLYRLPHARFRADVVYTNNPVTGAMRGFGNPQSTFFVELSMDRAAIAIGMDPLEFRLKNANRPFEETPQGLKITSCGLRECLQEVGETIDWSRRAGRTPAEPPASRPDPGRPDALQTSVRTGIGVAATLNVGGGARIYRSDGCGATVKVDDFGRVTLVTGATEIGQGSDIALAQIVAEVLGVEVEDVSLINNDTDLTPWDVGTHASRTTFIAGNAAWLAAQEARQQLLEFAATLLDAPAEELDLKDRAVFVKNDPERSIDLERLVRRMHFREGGEVVLGRGWYDPDTQLVDKDTYKGNISEAYGFGAHAAEVEVDTETGQVHVRRIVAAHDVGRAINPMYVEAQIEGGIQMGLGYALLEELYVRDGRILNADFHDYRLARSVDMPKIETIIIETEDPKGPFGAKGVGEMGINPVAAAIANAIYDAIGVRINSLPITPEKILRALEEKQNG